MNKIKKCFIVCWFGPLPKYFPIWLQTVKYNKEFDFLIFTDDKQISKYVLPSNVIFKSLTLTEFKKRAELVLHQKCSINKPYRICDYRPMFGLIFADELSQYDFWGYCDLDLVFGNIKEYITLERLSKYDAIFNGGHFTLIRNNTQMNNLFKEKGGAFSYRTVIKHNAIFAFDEITGIQQIAHKNKIHALFAVPYVDADVKHKQLRSVLDKVNPNYQSFYWEKGFLYRVKVESNVVKFQSLVYIHLQKRKIIVKSSLDKLKYSFWIMPDGFEEKKYMGSPTIHDIKQKNPYLGNKYMNMEEKKYKIKKIIEILKRNPFQILVRIIQAKNGIDKKQGTLEQGKWNEY